MKLFLILTIIVSFSTLNCTPVYSYYGFGQITISSKAAYSTVGGIEITDYYEVQYEWGNAIVNTGNELTSAVTAGIKTDDGTTDIVQEGFFKYDSSGPTSVYTDGAATTVPFKYLKDFDIINLTTSLTTQRSFKKGPFVIFDLQSVPACTGGDAGNIPATPANTFKIKFFCNDADATAFHTKLGAGNANKFIVLSDNTAPSATNLAAPANANVELISEYVLGNKGACD